MASFLQTKVSLQSYSLQIISPLIVLIHRVVFQINIRVRLNLAALENSHGRTAHNSKKHQRFFLLMEDLFVKCQIKFAHNDGKFFNMIITRILIPVAAKISTVVVTQRSNVFALFSSNASRSSPSGNRNPFKTSVYSTRTSKNACAIINF